jgi:DNA-binding MurR/RpiR family transcriptional regulator
VATVSRLVRKLGYRGLKDFKVELARSGGAGGSYFYQEIRPEDSESDLIEKVFYGNIKSLGDTLNLLDRDELLEAVDVIAGSNLLLFFGLGSSGSLARDAAMRFSFLGYKAQAFSDPNEIFFHARASGRGDVAVGVSHSGRTRITVEALRQARERGAATIGLSNYLRSPLQTESRYFFCTSFPESRVKIAALSSRVAQLCVLDTLYLLCARRREDLEQIEKMNDHLERVLRYPVKG